VKSRREEVLCLVTKSRSSAPTSTSEGLIPRDEAASHLLPSVPPSVQLASEGLPISTISNPSPFINTLDGSKGRYRGYSLR
jgi:hypothetical protein